MDRVGPGPHRLLLFMHLSFCRGRCLLPLQMALESKSPKLGQSALTGMQVNPDGSALQSFSPFRMNKLVQTKLVRWFVLLVTWLPESVELLLCFCPQKLLSEDRFLEDTDVLDQQLLSQMLEAVRVTPSLHEDLQVEVMKVSSAGEAPQE